MAAGAFTVGTTGTSMALPAETVAPPKGSATVLDADHNRAEKDPTRATGPGVYVVTLAETPSAAYSGGVPGLAATRARKGERFDRTRPEVVSYTAWLMDRQDRLLREVGDPEVLYRFTTAVNGFAAQLSTTQVKDLRATAGVALVELSTTQKLDTVDSPGFLGVDSAWRAAGGPDKAGRGTVIGVIDSGIWPENPSFAGLPLRSPGRSEQVQGFHGVCRAGEQWDKSDCNDKVIAARYYVKGFGRKNLAKSEYLSPRDGGGHGSHSASTAAGNLDVAMDIEGQDFGFASGMAPAARIAAYKVCWASPNPADDGCASADAVAAIDQAVADGVDVINYSISAAQDSLADSVELAFLNASAGGVFVAASAGNHGPAPGTVAHPSPWVTTVGASSHHLFQGALVLGDDTLGPYVGAMVSNERVASTRLVLSSDVAAAGATAEEARICEIGSLDASLVQDSIVVCDRGRTARVDKSVAVGRAGGAAMVLANVRPDSVDADFHSVPGVHVDVATGDEIKAYLLEAGPKATASINPSGADDTVVPQIAEFSSRGPSSADGNILKPDLTAPGVSVVAAVAPPSNGGRLWDLYSGASVSAPHVAGLAAFISGQRPDWSPAEIKSAMMTTADPLKGRAGAFAEGAGNVDPSEFLDPGLVLDTSAQDYLDFLAGQGFSYTNGERVSENPIGASELNLPSIAIGDLTRPVSVTRKVTNLSSTTQTFTADVTGLSGVDASAKPGRITVGGGRTRRITVTFAPGDNASLESFTQGALTLTSINNTVRIPIVVKPVLVDAPDEVTGTGSSGSLAVEGVSGTGDQVELSTAGLAYATPTGITLVPGGFDPTAPEADSDTFKVPVAIPEYTDIARFQMDAHNAGDDLDVFVYRDNELVGQSATGSADETVTLIAPEAGDYTVYVSSLSAANASTTTGQFYSWVVGQGDADNLTLTPTSGQTGPGGRFAFQVSWDGLDSARWFGAVRYGDSEHRTLVTIM